MDRNLREFRTLAARRGGRVYDAGLRELAIGYAREAQGRGSSLWRVSKDLGVWIGTLERWLAWGDGRRFRPVEVGPEVPVAVAAQGCHFEGLLIRTRGGHEIQGLDLAGAIQVLRGLESR